MVSITTSIGIYEEHYATILKWNGLAFKGKEPSKKDQETFNIFNVIYTDIVRENKEEKAANDE